MKLDSIFGDDRGVSPVIGVILMVAITVILAAVIGTFVLGLGGNIGSTATAGVSVSGDNVTLTNMGTAERVVVQGNSTSNLGNLTSVGDSVSIDGERPVDLIAVDENGEETLLRTVD